MKTAQQDSELKEDAEHLKRFRLIDLVGTGNYARVYKGVSASGRELAIKAINLAKTSDHYKSKFLPRELSILRQINHNNIVKVYEISQVGSRVYIVMAYCPRGTIADLLVKCGALTESVCRPLFSQIIDAIAYLHSQDYAHRDLKLENILLDNNFDPKITDFSYSINTSIKQEQVRLAQQQKIQQQQAQFLKVPILHIHQTINTGQPALEFQIESPPSPTTDKHSPRSESPPGKLSETFCGTLPYLSPEMIRQHLYDAKKTDVWSLGVCLFICLNNRTPFIFDNVKLMVHKQLIREYKFRSSLKFSPQVLDLVYNIFEPDFKKRCTAAQILRHPWITSGPREKPIIINTKPDVIV